MDTLSRSSRLTALPSSDDSRLAESASRSLQGVLSGHPSTLRIQVSSKGSVEAIEIPSSALDFLLQVLVNMAAGNAVTLVPVHHELSTQQAADILNVSRPYLIGLLEQGKIPFNRVGNRRRIRFSDLMAYKVKSNENREKALGALVDEAQEFGMGY